jgi:hypothetical protein
MSEPLIVFATRYFQRAPPFDQIPTEVLGHFSDDRSKLKDADAVIFHIPDFTYRRFGDTPKYRGQLWVAWSMESDINYELQADPVFLRHFDLSIGYKRSADLWAGYMPPLEEWQRAKRAPLAMLRKAAIAVMFQSAAENQSGRIELAKTLMKHMHIDSYGKVLHNCDLEQPDRGAATKKEIIGRYYFCLAFENSISTDYVTEKLFEPLMAGTVPVYLGAPNAQEFAPHHSFIRADEYGGAKGLADYLHHLREHPDEYQAYLAWRDKPLPQSLSDLALRIQHQNVWRHLVQTVANGKKKSNFRRSSHLPFGYRAALRSRLAKVIR